MSARQHFQKALLLLDKNAPDRGEATLRLALASAKQENDRITLTQSLVCLGELLYATGRPAEARAALEDALKVTQDDVLDDVLAHEHAQAKTLLTRLETSA